MMQDMLQNKNTPLNSFVSQSKQILARPDEIFKYLSEISSIYGMRWTACSKNSNDVHDLLLDLLETFKTKKAKIDFIKVLE
jgi:hypothetical protein